MEYCRLPAEVFDKTEIDSESLMNGSWQAGYLAEYDKNKQKMTLYPLLPKRVKSFNLVLP